MGVEIQLLNQHYKWEEIRYNGIRYIFKGNLFYNNELLSAERLVHLLSPLVLHNKTFDIKRLHEFLKYMNGEFALVVDTPEEVICSVDRIRSIPLFYAQKNDEFIISDDAYYIKNSIDSKLIEENAAEFLITGYVIGEETLFDGIKQIQAGEFLVFDKRNNSARNFCHYCFYPKDLLDLSEDDLLYNLDAVFINAFKRLIESTVNKGMQIVVPLSGGLDSRVIVAMLKRLGVKDVICFSYGKKNNREAKISKKVSEALGYKFFFVEYTNKKLYKCFRSENLKRYNKYASNLVSMPHIQDYLALEELIKEGKLPENSVIVPGHLGMLFRAHVPKNASICSKNNAFKDCVEGIFKKHYILWPWNKEEILNQIFEEKIRTCFEDIKIDDYASCSNAMRLFDIKEKQTKFILNSVRTYEFFEYEWRIPLCDLELTDFFMKLPLEYRIDKYLCKKYAREMLFVDDLESLKEIDCTTGLVDPNNNHFNRIIQRCGEISYHAQARLQNPIWGRYFKRPLLSRLCLRIKKIHLESMDKYPLLKMIIDYKNETKSSISINGMMTLNYLLDTINEK